MAAIAGATDLAATEAAAEAIRRGVEQTLAQEQVNLTSEEGRRRTEEIIDQRISAFHAEALNGQQVELSDEERATLARALRDDFVGLGTIAERMLHDPDAQEWMINTPKRVFRDNGHRIERVPEVVFTDDRQVNSFLDRLLERVEGKHLDRITPRIEARLPDGSRITAAIPPVSSNGHTICSIRRFRLPAGNLRELVELEFLSEQAAAFLQAAVRAGKNIVVAGRVSSGKTTLINALGRAIPGSERVVVCESSAELHLPAVLDNCVGYEARPESVDGLKAVTLEDLVSDSLRMNPDRIIVGECRGPETMAMLWAIATGHSGMTSVHGESTEHALVNLARFALTSGARIEGDQALDWLREVDLVVHCDRPRSFDGGDRRFLARRVDEIVEVAGVEGRRMTLNPLFEGAGPALTWAAAGPAFLPDLEAAGFTPPQ
ncbi:MAG TPA: ATPase, T2SS/T4P/T4SS family [Solirubrobacteraceae bacterium]|jgi:pilus assembly protein CpaF|nr:ATPase, T2SS/T4P/T4SS family [Solirubrobacteraceae bacterium]